MKQCTIVVILVLSSGTTVFGGDLRADGEWSLRLAGGLLKPVGAGGRGRAPRRAAQIHQPCAARSLKDMRCGYPPFSEGETHAERRKRAP